MHMSDALLSVPVAAATWGAAAAAIAYSSRRLQKKEGEKTIPLMGVLGAFVFAAQMINFSIPATGSSGHLGGGMFLAILLGPEAALLIMASVLSVQALFFADGGLLALGANIVNLGLIPAFVAYPLFYRNIAGEGLRPGRLVTGAFIAVIFALQLGAFAVVLETSLSGISDLPFISFLSLMQPIHLAIGVVEGVITSLVLLFLLKTDEQVFRLESRHQEGQPFRRNLIAGFLLAALLLGGLGSWLASEHPDGLEWAISRVAGKEEIAAPPEGVHKRFAALQEWMSFLPDYNFRTVNVKTVATPEGKNGESVFARRIGVSVSGLLGAGVIIIWITIIGLFLRKRVGARSADG